MQTTFYIIMKNYFVSLVEFKHVVLNINNSILTASELSEIVLSVKQPVLVN